MTLIIAVIVIGLVPLLGLVFYDGGGDRDCER